MSELSFLVEIQIEIRSLLQASISQISKFEVLPKVSSQGRDFEPVKSLSIGGSKKSL